MTRAKSPLEREVDRIKVFIYGLAAALVIVFTMLVYGIAQNTKAINQGHTAICQEKSYYHRNIAQTEKFLKQHPGGIPGVPNSLLLQGLHATEAQLHALKDISCS